MATLTPNQRKDLEHTLSVARVARESGKFWDYEAAKRAVQRLPWLLAAPTPTVDAVLAYLAKYVGV
jgi:hypothetical protein